MVSKAGQVGSRTRFGDNSPYRKSLHLLIDLLQLPPPLTTSHKSLLGVYALALGPRGRAIGSHVRIFGTTVG